MSVKYFEFSKGLLAGVTHNKINSLEFISIVLDWERFTKNSFDYYLLELNRDNYNFIEKNKLNISEFYHVIKSRTKEKIVLFDMAVKTEVSLYKDYTKRDFYIDYLNFKLDKFLYYKMRNYLAKYNKVDSIFNYQTNYFLSHFHFTHILKREEHFIEEIKKYLDQDKTLFIMVGTAHFEIIKNFIIKYSHRMNTL
jgi:hypothetical protein